MAEKRKRRELSQALGVSKNEVQRALDEQVPGKCGTGTMGKVFVKGLIGSDGGFIIYIYRYYIIFIYIYHIFYLYQYQYLYVMGI
jgi:hypothetical protein